jgi:hypothetical protein
MLCFSPLLALAAYCAYKFPDINALNVCAGILLLGSLAFSWYFSEQTATFMIHDNLGFKNAFLHSIFPFLSMWSFLPFCGFIERLKEKHSYTNPYTQDDSKQDSN